MSHTGRRTRSRSRGPPKKKQAITRSGYVPPRAQPGGTRVGGYYARYNVPLGAAAQERKFFDVDVDDAVITATWAFFGTGTINNIATGTGESGRIGRKITVKKVMWKYTVTLPDTTVAASTRDTVRLVLYLDKQCNGATAAQATMWQSDNYHTFRNLENSARYRILHDKVIDLNSQAGGTSGAGVHQFGADSVSGTFYHDCTIPIEFSSTTGAITEIRSNNLNIVVISKNGLCGLDSKVRLRYLDN